jgi:CheY-like chemotaxis protein
MKVASTIIIKTANSGERLLDEISMFLHLVHESDDSSTNYLKKLKTYKNNLDLKDKLILIVDDDIKNAFVLTAALEETNADVLTAKNGREALQVIRDNPAIDLILMDIMMPVMNGYEAIEAIRADKKISHIPVIAATAKALKDDKAKCFEAGANDYITKPIDLDVLLNLVETWIDKSV